MIDDLPPLPMDALAIRKILPHRYPFLFIDRVIALDVATLNVEAIKCVSQNEPFFQGHFPDYPVLPGVIQIEALAQTGAVLGLLIPENIGKIAFLTGVDGFKFRRQVMPGDVLHLQVNFTRFRRGFGKASARATVDGELASEGELSFLIQTGGG